MRSILSFVTVATFVVASFALSGCNTSSCGGTQANCDSSWDFYEKCDLIEGRQERCCNQTQGCCPQPQCAPGITSEVSSPCGATSSPCGAPAASCGSSCGSCGGTSMPSGAVILEEEIIEETAPGIGQ